MSDPTAMLGRREAHAFNRDSKMQSVWAAFCMAFEVIRGTCSVPSPRLITRPSRNNSGARSHRRRDIDMTSHRRRPGGACVLLIHERPHHFKKMPPLFCPEARFLLSLCGNPTSTIQCRDLPRAPVGTVNFTHF